MRRSLGLAVSFTECTNTFALLKYSATFFFSKVYLLPSITMAKENVFESSRATIPDTPSPEYFSVFTKGQKHWIVALIAFTAWFSTVSSFVYYPAIVTLAADLKTTVERINLTVTSYLIVSGIIPSITGTFADVYGRRPLCIVSLAVYLTSNIGLAFQNSFPALFLLRMLQSAGISGITSN